jgi:rubrerythrin
MKQATSGSAGAYAGLQTAIQMEELGRDFYEALGAATSDSATADLCRELAAAESSHIQVFRRMCSELARDGKTFLLRDSELAEARQAVKDAILPDRDTVLRLASAGSVSDILEMAIKMEKESADFYRALASQLSDATAIEGIIREEENHLRLLSNYAQSR